MLYQVTKQYTRGGEFLDAEFADLEEARFFIQAKMADDARFKVKVIYRIKNGVDVIQVFDPDDASTTGQTAQGQSQGQGQQSSNVSSFRPTPFNASPRPKGSPPPWWKDEEDGKKK